MSAPALAVEDLSLSVTRGGEVRPLLDRVSLVVDRGEIVGLVGESGSGKSLTSKSALGMFPKHSKVSGSVRVDGREVVGASRSEVMALRRTGAAMIFQDPRASVNPVRRLGDFLIEGVVAAGVPKQEARTRAVTLLAEVGLRDPEASMDAYPQQFSGGMLQRVMVAAALMSSPGLLLADEATTALDVTTQAEVVALLRGVQQTHGTGTLLVTHDLELAAAACDRVYVMYAGRMVEASSSADLFTDPLHPYTRGLLASSPPVRGPKRELQPIPGRPLALVDAGAGCAFRERCAIALDRCGTQVPDLSVHGHRSVACYAVAGDGGDGR